MVVGCLQWEHTRFGNSESHFHHSIGRYFQHRSDTLCIQDCLNKKEIFQAHKKFTRQNYQNLHEPSDWSEFWGLASTKKSNAKSKKMFFYMLLSQALFLNWFLSEHVKNRFYDQRTILLKASQKVVDIFNDFLRIEFFKIPISRRNCVLKLQMVPHFIIENKK